MSYAAPIDRAHPTAFFFMLDQSGSMSDPFGGGESTKKKSEGLADAINKMLQNLVIKCARESGVHDYFDIAIIGYGNGVSSAWSGALAGRDMVPLSQIANNPARVEERNRKVDDGAGGLVEERIKFPVWFDPTAIGGTPMCEAFSHVRGLLEKWVANHPDSYPPIILNITDGESTDGDPGPAGAAIREIGTRDGNILLFNLHLSSTSATPILFPDSDVGLPDQYARMLFGMCSVMPPIMRSFAASEGFAVSEASRGYGFNADLVSLIRFLDIGTRPANLR